MTVIIDAHEPPNIKKYASSPSDIKTLDVGDIFVTGDCDKFLIERKTWKDLMNSIRDGRLWNQMARLKQVKEQGITPLIVIDGNKYWAFKSGTITLPQYYGILKGVAKFGITVMDCNTKTALECLIDLLDKSVGKKTEYSPPTCSKPAGRKIEEERADMFSAMNGIGNKTARKLVDECITIDGLCDELKRPDSPVIDKILGNKKEHVKKVMLGENTGFCENYDLQVISMKDDRD